MRLTRTVTVPTLAGSRRGHRVGRSRRAGALIALGAAVALAGCVSPPPVTETAAVESSTTQTSPTATGGQAGADPSPSPSASAPVECDNATMSYPPSSTSAYADRIRQRGYLLVGVSADTRLLGAVNPNDQNTFDGFDIAMAKIVAKAVTGDETKIRYKVITTAQRIPQLQQEVDEQNNAAGGVDLVARALTMTCARWNDIAFSAEYFNAAQKVMVPSASGIKTVADLAERRVCAAKGSTSLRRITEEVPEAEPVGLDRHTDCLTALQQGQVDAITGDDAILAGFVDQDPTTVVLSESLSSEPYGLGVNAEHPDFAAFVNQALATAIADGSWQAAYDRTLRKSLGQRTPPKPRYGDR